MKFFKRHAYAVCALTAACFVAGPLLAHFHIVPPLVGFGLFALSALMGILSMAIGVATIKSKQVQTGVMLFSIGALPVFIVGYSLSTSGGHPRINDISTDLKDPPVLIDQRHPETPVTLDEKTIAVIREKYGDISPLRSEKSVEEVFEVVSDELQSQEGWTIVKKDTDPSSGTMFIYGFEQFGIFQFTDDFTVRISPDPRDGSGSVIDMRSKSRDGKADFGINARRIRGFLNSLTSKI